MLLVESLQLGAPLDSITWSDLNRENPNLRKLTSDLKRIPLTIF